MGQTEQAAADGLLRGFCPLGHAGLEVDSWHDDRFEQQTSRAERRHYCIHHDESAILSRLDKAGGQPLVTMVTLTGSLSDERPVMSLLTNTPCIKNWAAHFQNHHWSEWKLDWDVTGCFGQ